jgi:superoxide dismutase, Cu-Zn family
VEPARAVTRQGRKDLEANMNRVLFFLALPFLAGGCMTGVRTGTTGSAAQPQARATLSSADGGARGSATISQAQGGLLLHLEAQGLPPGAHGIHIHAVGRCDAPDYQSAGPHWNPANRQHGRDNPQGAHHGDLPNITIDANGRGMLQANVAGANWAEFLDADGASVVIHAAADDYRTDPSGNSGSRIACGVIQQSQFER